MSATLDFRAQIIQTVHEWAKKRTDLRLYVENGVLPDVDKDERPIVMLEIRYLNSEQADLNAQPLIRDEGKILVTVLVKQHSGSLKGYQLREELTRLLQRKYFGEAKTFIGEKVANVEIFKSWIGYRVAIPFHHYYFD